LFADCLLYYLAGNLHKIALPAGGAFRHGSMMPRILVRRESLEFKLTHYPPEPPASMTEAVLYNRGFAPSFLFRSCS
jgi:hypothetical protein